MNDEETIDDVKQAYALLFKAHGAVVSERDELASRVRAMERDAMRYQFIRNGGACIDQDEGGVYMATETAGKYYTDLRDFDMDIDDAIASKEQP